MHICSNKILTQNQLFVYRIIYKLIYMVHSLILSTWGKLQYDTAIEP